MHTLQADKAALTAPVFIMIIRETRVRVIGGLICFVKLDLQGAFTKP